MFKRTPEQKAADEKLTEAVNGVCDAYGYTGPNTVNLSYVVLLEQRVLNNDDEGDDSGLVTIMRDGDIPWVTLIGLLRTGQIRAEHSYNHGTDEEDGG